MADTRFTKYIYIIGAGGLGRELNGFIKTSNSNINVQGFIDDELDALRNFSTLQSQDKVFGEISLRTLSKAKSIIIAITNSDLKKRIFNWQEETKAFEILSYIHPKVTLGSDILLNTGVVILPNALISSHSTIGNGCFINCGSQIGHDVKIGNYVNIMASVNIGGEAKIGDNVFIGTGAIVFPRISITDNVRIGAGTVVMRSIKKPGTYMGNPAKRIF